MPNPWTALEQIRGLIALPSVWNKLTGADFEAFRSLCLQPAPWRARSFPCPLAASCVYRVAPSSPAQPSALNPAPFTGTCERSSHTCPPISLSETDVTPLQLDRLRFGRALCQALGLDPKVAELSPPHTIQIGSWSADAVPVILTMQTERRSFRLVLCELIVRLRRKFILLAPTSRHLDADCQELLQNASAAFFPLETAVRLTDNGTLQPTKAPGELFAKFNPEEKLPEDAALRAFAILKSMDSDQPIRKAPAFTVFRLYCMENLSLEQVRKKLQCSRGTITNRLRTIRQKTGIDPAALRAYSAQFTRIEQTLSDPRARRIASRSAADEPDAEQE